jgi:protein O-GlcNAc transferase
LIDSQTLLVQAGRFHKSGNLAEAEHLYLKALALEPLNLNALHLLGVVRFQQGRNSEALRLIGTVLSVNPNIVAALSNFGLVLRSLGRLDEALESFDKSLTIKPNYAEALYNRGLTLLALSRFEEALASCEKALAIKPHYAEAFNLRGKALRGLNRCHEELASYEKALEFNPQYAEALYNRGYTLHRLKRLEEALVSFDGALAIKPDHVESLHNRGVTLHCLKRLAEALSSFDKVLALEPNHFEALHNRGVTLSDLNRLGEALTNYNEALAIKPDFVLALINRANVLQTLGQTDQAIASLKHAIAIEPAEPKFHSNLIFSLNFHPSTTEFEKQFERSLWDVKHAQRYASSVKHHTNIASQDRRLRIGYVTSHFRRQSATYSFGGVILSHDPEHFEVFCYSDTEKEDDVTTCLRTRADNWCDTKGYSDDQLAQLIRSQQIDILVDLVGHMTGHRLGVFARKPAPVQVTAWGEPTGTGLKAMDYLLADSILVPESIRPLLSENVVSLPNFLGYWSPEPLPPPGPLPALGREHITFGSFNRLEKITNPTIRCWASILRKLPAAHLLLKDAALDDADQRARIKAAFFAEGVSAERLKCMGGSNRGAHFGAYQRIDIALDPFPHGGGMTTLDALWMGVPVVTWSGETISSRLAAASLTALGLTDFVATDPETYVDLAIAKASNIEYLSLLRTSLRERLATSEFGDCSRYSRAVETAYREIWHRWCAARNGHSLEIVKMNHNNRRRLNQGA